MWLECWIECDVCHQAMELSHIIQLPDGSYVPAGSGQGEPVSVQQYYLDHPPELTPTQAPKQTGGGWLRRLLHRT